VLRVGPITNDLGNEHEQQPRYRHGSVKWGEYSPPESVTVPLGDAALAVNTHTTTLAGMWQAIATHYGILYVCRDSANQSIMNEKCALWGEAADHKSTVGDNENGRFGGEEEEGEGKNGCRRTQLSPLLPLHNSASLTPVPSGKLTYVLPLSTYRIGRQFKHGQPEGAIQLQLLVICL